MSTTSGRVVLGLATIIRHTAGAISAFVGILLVLPSVLRALPNSMFQAIGPYLPSRIGATILSINPHNLGQNAFSPWVGLLVMAGYTVALLVIGGVLMVRRDA
jgi:ABC-2 type transport system permease protein